MIQAAKRKPETTRRERWNPLLCSYPESERINACSIGAEVMFIRLIAKADDYGNFYSDPALLLAYLFGHRMAKGEVSVDDMARWRDELAANGLLVLYGSRANYLHVVNPRRRLRKDVKPDERFPREPEDADRFVSSESVTNTGRTRNEFGPLDADTDADKSQNNMVGKADLPRVEDSSGEVLEHLNTATERSGPCKFTSGAGLKSRLRDGATVDDCRLVIDLKIAQWNHDEAMRPYIRPKTLFSVQNFSGYLAEAKSWDVRGRPALVRSARNQKATGRSAKEYEHIVERGAA